MVTATEMAAIDSQSDSDSDGNGEADLGTPAVGKASIEHHTPDPGQHFCMDGADLQEKMGVSGMAITAHTNADFFQLIGISLQSWILQFVMFWGLKLHVYTVIDEHSAGCMEKKDPAEIDLKTVIIIVALMLHFVNCFGEIPFSLNILLRIHHFHDTAKELLLAGPIFFMDAIIVPGIQLLLGALFICTSGTAIDVLLNSCAVAFVSQIDNWILSLNSSMIDLAGETKGCTVMVPYNKLVSQVMQWTICACPILPLTFAYFMLQWASAWFILAEDCEGIKCAFNNNETLDTFKLCKAAVEAAAAK